MKKLPNGVVVWEGPSAINGKPTVAILTGIRRPSANPKTGPMLQLWILYAGESPVDAARNGNDDAVCGGCKHRPAFGGTCYVSLFHGPRAVWATWANGDYPHAEDIPAIVRGRFVRLGAYGDPAALPQEIIHTLTQEAAGHTGYTHQWKARRFNWLRDYVQASVDNLQEYTLATKRSWGTFRVRMESEPLEAEEWACPASPEGGHTTTCSECLACNGSQAHIAIIVHGARSKQFDGTHHGRS